MAKTLVELVAYARELGFPESWTISVQVYPIYDVMRESVESAAQGLVDNDYIGSPSERERLLTELRDGLPYTFFGESGYPVAPDIVLAFAPEFVLTVHAVVLPDEVVIIWNRVTLITRMRDVLGVDWLYPPVSEGERAQGVYRNPLSMQEFAKQVNGETRLDVLPFETDPTYYDLQWVEQMRRTLRQRASDAMVRRGAPRAKADILAVDVVNFALQRKQRDRQHGSAVPPVRGTPHLVRFVADNLSIHQRGARRIVEAFFDVIEAELKAGGSVELDGIGTLSTFMRKSYSAPITRPRGTHYERPLEDPTGVYPYIGPRATIPAQRRLKFAPSPQLFSNIPDHF